LANRLAGLSIETRHGSDVNPIRGCGERVMPRDKLVRTGQESSAMTPSAIGKVMALISGRSGGGECRTFRLESADMFVNPFAGPWNDEAVLVRFRQDLASHPEKLEEILAAYVRQDPALAPRLLALALARRPVAAIKLASVAASAGSLGRVGVLGLLLAATATGIFGSADQGNAAEAKPAHPADANGIASSGLMSVSAVAALLVGAGNALAASSATVPASADGAASLHDGSAAHGDGALEVQSGAVANAVTDNAAGASYGDRANLSGNTETIGSGHAAANPASDHAVTQGTAQTTDSTHGHAQSVSQEGAIDAVRSIDGGNHWGHAADPTVGWNAQSGTLPIFAQEHDAGAAGGLDKTSSEKGADPFAHAADGTPTLGSDAQNASTFADTGLGFEKGASFNQGAGTETVSSFLSPSGIFSLPAASIPTAGNAGYESPGALAKSTIDVQQLGQVDTSSLLGASDASHGIQPLTPSEPGEAASGSGAGLPGLQSFTGAGDQHDGGGSSFLAPANGVSLGLDGLTSAFKEIGSALASSLANPAAPGNPLSVPGAHEGSFLSLNDAGVSGGLPGHAGSTASADVGAAQIGSMSSFLHGIENGFAGAGIGDASSAPLTAGGQGAPLFGSSLPIPGIAEALHSIDGLSVHAATAGSAQAATPAAAGSNHASNSIASTVSHTLAEAFSWQGESSGGDHGVTLPAFADWTHIGSGHSG
jgi:hypothetical protein